MKSIFFRPNLSDSIPEMIPPVATPMRKIISATIFKYFLSHTRFHWLFQVLPRPSVMLYSHSRHSIILVVFGMEKFSFAREIDEKETERIRSKQSRAPLGVVITLT